MASSSKTTTGITQAVLTSNGYVCDLVERWIAQAKLRKDFLGFADIIAIGPFFPEKPPIPGCLAVQCTNLGNLSNHITKITSGPTANNLAAWLDAGNRFEVWGWAKRERKRQKLRPIYTPTIRTITCDHFGFYTEDITEMSEVPTT